jgi:hypothetical protein
VRDFVFLFLLFAVCVGVFLWVLFTNPSLNPDYPQKIEVVGQENP